MKGWTALIALIISLTSVVTSLSVQLQQDRPSVISGFSKNDPSIDTALYSRQLFVYGESAQLALKSSTILVVGSGLLNNELVKNIALTGVGKIIFVNQPNESIFPIKSPSLLGACESAAQYAADINRNVLVRTGHLSRHRF